MSLNLCGQVSGRVFYYAVAYLYMAFETYTSHPGAF